GCSSTSAASCSVYSRRWSAESPCCPTRRSSDLTGDPVGRGLVASLARPGGNLTGVAVMATELMPKRLELLSELVPRAGVIALLRSEEHTSELQSLAYLVCRLLRDKKHFPDSHDH